MNNNDEKGNDGQNGPTDEGQRGPGTSPTSSTSPASSGPSLNVDRSSSQRDATPSPSRSPAMILGSESQIDLDGKASKKLDANGNTVARIDDQDGGGKQVNEANGAFAMPAP